jgi:hypothetical protein
MKFCSSQEHIDEFCWQALIEDTLGYDLGTFYAQYNNPLNHFVPN